MFRLRRAFASRNAASLNMTEKRHPALSSGHLAVQVFAAIKKTRDGRVPIANFSKLTAEC